MIEPAPSALGATPRWARAWGIGMAVVVLAAVAWVVWATHAWGLGVSPDSVVYLVTAGHVADGVGLIGRDPTRLATPHYPPLYPILLAGLGAVSDEVRAAARWLNVVLAALNVVLIALLGYRAAGRAGALIAAVMIGLNAAVLEAHAWLLTEPLALAFTLAGLVLLVDSLAPGVTPRRRRWLLLWAALATAAACVTRYASISLIGSGALSILIASRGRRRQGLLDAATFAAVASAPLALWFVRNRLLAGTTANRRFEWFGFTQDHLKRLGETADRWFAAWPENLAQGVVAVAIAAAGAVVTSLVLRRRAVADALPHDYVAARHAQFARVRDHVLFPFAGCYAGLVAVTIVLLDRSTPLDARILLPLQAAVMLLAISLVVDVVTLKARGHVLAAAMIAFVAASGLGRSIALGRALARDGQGYTAGWWPQSPTMRLAGRLPASAVLYSNAPEVLYVHLGRQANLIPRAYEPDAPRRLRWEDATIVWFNRYRRGGTLQAEEAYVRNFRLVRVARTADGSIYRVAPAPAATSPTTQAR